MLLAKGEDLASEAFPMFPQISAKASESSPCPEMEQKPVMLASHNRGAGPS